MLCGQSAAVNSASSGLRLMGSPARRATESSRARKEAFVRGVTVGPPSLCCPCITCRSRAKQSRWMSRVPCPDHPSGNDTFATRSAELETDRVFPQAPEYQSLPFDGI